MNLNKNFLTEVIKYLISKGVTVHDVLDTFNEHFNTLDAFNDSLKKMPTEIKRGTINNVIEEPVLPKYTMTESDKIRLESVSPSPETLNKVFDFSKEKKQYELRKPITDLDLLLCGKSVEENSTPCATVDSNRDLCQKVEKNAENTEKPVSKSWIDYPKTVKNHGNGVSPARKALFDVVGDKTVIEHLRANGIDYKVYDNRVRRKWSVADACTTPLAPRGRHKSERVIEEPRETETAVIIPDSVKVVEETSPKTKMMLVNGRMTEMKVSDTDLVQSSIIEEPEEPMAAPVIIPDTNVICLEPEKITGVKIKVVEESSTLEKPEETLESETKTSETESNTEKATESVTIEPQIKTDTDTRVNDADVNNDVKNDESERIEQLTDKVVRDIVTGKNKEKKKAEPKKDYTMADVCFKLNVTTHELKEMINTGEFPQPDCGNKWSVKLLKDKNLI